MIIGTAGHIDHGKSALVTALTGRPMDRLAEERRRGITIDLNFAPLDLGNGNVTGIVDVPGHEDFVRTMVAGASGIAVVLLVIAADEGMMPQTDEHLAIVEYLGVSTGIPVITKSDLADPEWLEFLELDIAERLAGSPVGFEAPIAVSAKTGHGIDALRERLRHRERAYATSTRRSADASADAFRLPVDRVFSVGGIGTVVTGTAWSGQVEVGDRVLVLPSGAEGRVRSIESYGRQVDRSPAGARVALGLANVDRADVQRGQVIVTDQIPWTAVSALDVELMLHSSARHPIGTRARARLHLGTAEIITRILPRNPIEPGGNGIARLALERPMIARGGDRFVLRSFSPVATIGGGCVLDPIPPRRTTVWPAELRNVDPAARLRALLARRPTGIETAALPLFLGLPIRAAEAIASVEPSLRRIGSHWITEVSMANLADRALETVRQFHHRQKSDPGIPLETLRRSLRTSDWQLDAMLTDLTKTRRLRSKDGIVALPGFAPRVEGGDTAIDRLVAVLIEADLTPPSTAELERREICPDVGAALRLAAAAGRVEAVERDRYYAREALDRFVVELQALGRDGLILPAAVRDRLGISRKYFIPLLEWADAKGLTVRVAEGRQLRT